MTEDSESASRHLARISESLGRAKTAALKHDELKRRVAELTAAIEDSGNERPSLPEAPVPSASGVAPPSAVPRGDDEHKAFRVREARRNIGGGRSVSVGYAEDDHEHTFLRFINDQGTETKLRLSNAAADALREMLSEGRSIIDFRRAEWTLVCKIVDPASEMPATDEARAAGRADAREVPT